MPFFKVYCVAFPEAAAGAAPAGDAVKPPRPANTEVAAAPRSANTASAGARPGFMADGPMESAAEWRAAAAARRCLRAVAPWRRAPRARPGQPHSGAAPAPVAARRCLDRAHAARKP